MDGRTSVTSTNHIDTTLVNEDLHWNANLATLGEDGDREFLTMIRWIRGDDGDVASDIL